MSNQTGLSDRGQFAAFTLQWRDSALKEARKWCQDDNTAQLLADAVLAELRKKYADKDPPRQLDYYLRAQVCLIYSQTGQSTGRLKEYIAAQYFDDEQDASAAPVSGPQAAPDVQPEPLTPAQEEAVSAAPPPPAAAPAPEHAAEETPAKVETPVPPAPPDTRAAAPAADSAPKAQDAAQPDTFFDPVRTTLWKPENEQFDHVVKEIVLPDEEEEERSVMLSFVNTILFVLTAASFGFCFYQTGFLQYLMQ